MRYEIGPCNASAYDAHAEAIDYEDEGKVYVVCFSGPDAKEHAEEFAAWKNILPARDLAGTLAV